MCFPQLPGLNQQDNSCSELSHLVTAFMRAAACLAIVSTSSYAIEMAQRAAISSKQLVQRIRPLEFGRRPQYQLPRVKACRLYRMDLAGRTPSDHMKEHTLKNTD